MQEVDRRLDRMIEIAEARGVPLDHVVKHIGRCDRAEFDAVSADPSRLPPYVPNIFKSVRAG